jgi:hypothetical protein
MIGKFYKENNILGVYVYYYNPVHAWLVVRYLQSITGHAWLCKRFAEW